MLIHSLSIDKEEYNENSLTFDFIVKNNDEATTEYVKASFEH